MVGEAGLVAFAVATLICILFQQWGVVVVLLALAAITCVISPDFGDCVSTHWSRALEWASLLRGDTSHVRGAEQRPSTADIVDQLSLRTDARPPAMVHAFFEQRRADLRRALPGCVPDARDADCVLTRGRVYCV